MSCQYKLFYTQNAQFLLWSVLKTPNDLFLGRSNVVKGYAIYICKKHDKNSVFPLKKELSNYCVLNLRFES